SSLLSLNLSALCVFEYYVAPPISHSFPTRRSSDLTINLIEDSVRSGSSRAHAVCGLEWDDSFLMLGLRDLPSDPVKPHGPLVRLDRKSTRLNSSHVKISYAVFCLEKSKI